MDDSSIADKKNEKENGGKRLNFKKFAISFFGHFLITICLCTVVIGAFGLYTAKVAQSNILPINPDWAPYTENDYIMDSDIAVFMNIVKERGAKGLNFWAEPISVTAQKATFIKEDFNDNGVFKYLCEMKSFTEKNEYFSRMMFFLRKIFIRGVISSFGMIKTIYSSLYLLPEWFLMLIYFTIFPIIFIFLFLYNGVKIFIEAVSNLTLPFRESNTTHNGNGIEFTYKKPSPDDPTAEWWRPWTTPEINQYKHDNEGWFFGTITKIIDYTGNGLMFMIYVMLTLNVIIPISLAVTVFGLTNPLLRKYKLDKENEDGSEHGIGDFLRDTFVYKKTFIIFLAVYNLLMSTGVYLEAGYTFSCFVGILILVLYFEVFITPDALKINTDDVTQQIFKNNEYSKTKQANPSQNGNFEPCKATSNIDVKGSDNKTIVHRIIPKKKEGKITQEDDNEVYNPLIDESSDDYEPSYEKASNVIESPKVKSDFFGPDAKAKIDSTGKTFRNARKGARTTLGNAKLSVKSLGRNINTGLNKTSDKVRNIPDKVRNILNPKSNYQPLDEVNSNFGVGQLQEDTENTIGNPLQNKDNPIQTNQINTPNTSNDVNNPLITNSIKGGAKRTKGGALYNKYNFSLI